MKTNPKILLSTALFILLIAISPVAGAQVSANQTRNMADQQEVANHYYNFDHDFISIFFDGGDQLSHDNAMALLDSIGLMTPNVEAYEVKSLSDIEMTLMQKQIEIAIYVFPTDYKNLIIHDQSRIRNVRWTSVGSMLTHFPDTYHIIASGNSKNLLDVLPSSIRSSVFASNEEQSDANQLFVFTLWQLADILEQNYDGKYAALGNDIRMATLQYFSNHFNELVTSSVKPITPVGVQDPVTVEQRTQKFYDEHPVQVQKIAAPGYVIDPETNRQVNAKTGEVRQDYVMDIFPSTSSVAGDFLLQFLPEDSGLRGPIGGIVDKLLDVLIDYVGDQIGLSSSTVESLANALFSIPDFIGAVKDPSASKLKSFLDKLKPLIPLPQDMLDYFDLLVDGLFLLRGDSGDIVNFITAVIGKVIPDDFSVAGVNLESLLGQLFSLGTEVFNQINSGKNAMEIILSALNSQILANLTSLIIGNSTLFGYSSTDINKAIGYITSFIQMGSSMISSFNIKDLINEYGPKLLHFGMSELGISEDQSKMIMQAASMVLTTTGSFKNANIEEILTEFFKLASGFTGASVATNSVATESVSPDTVDLTQIKNQVAAILKIVSDAVDSGMNSITDFKNAIDAALTLPGIAGTQYADAIKEVMALVLSVKSTSFHLDSLTDIASVVGHLLQQFNIVDAKYVNITKDVIKAIVGLINFIKNPPNFKQVLGRFLDNLPDMKSLIQEAISLLLNFVIPGAVTPPSMAATMSAPNPYNEVRVQGLNKADAIKYLSETAGLIFQLISKGGDNSIQSLLMTLLNGGTFILSQVTGIDLKPYIELFKGIFGQFLGLTDKPISLDELLPSILALVPDGKAKDVINQILPFVMMLRDVFTNGFQAIFAKLTEWLTGKITDLISGLSSQFDSILGNESWDFLDLDIPLGIGSFSLFTINLKMGLKPGFDFNAEKLTNMIFDLVFKGVSIFKDGADFASVLKTALSFVSIVPIFTASFELKDFGSGDNSFMSFLLETLGVELTITGSGFFELMLLRFENGVFSMDDFFKVLGWGFKFTITISKTLTLLDFLTGGAGGSLNSIGKYIGLDAISITIYLTLAFEIIKRAATANKPETGTMTISLTIGFTVTLGIDIVIAKLKLWGTLEITLTLLQDLVAPVPLDVYIAIQLTIGVTIGFLFWDWDFDYKWSPNGYEPPLGKKVSGNSPKDAAKKGAIGLDQDGDGLSDQYENSTAGLNFLLADSDGDGLDDKLESQTLHSDPAAKDSDGDGLDDKTEYDIHTNLLAQDTDFDGLTDYEEAAIYGTNPLAPDTDLDGLDDSYEVNHVYNLTGLTPSVKKVMIGGVAYTDRTDPLNPDTDGDMLLDGEEGDRGIYYGPETYDDPGDNYTPDPVLIFNNGYTSPLDNDTDDDSYWQLYDGSIAPVEEPFLYDMNDYIEIHGRWVTFIDTDTGEPLAPVLVHTNPVNPDSDGDTGVTAADRLNPPFGAFLSSDGYELSRDPPTDPNDADSDDDGLIDGFEGMLKADSNHTWGLNPDTDGDGLGDFQEVQLGTNGRSVDTDHDGVSDGDEFFKFHTNPFLDDSDSDGLLDGEELFLYHSNPLLRDSDADGIPDYDEVWKYFSKPMDEDSDNDGLTDFEEIFIHYTDPFAADTDGDGLLDGDEVKGLTYTVSGSDFLVFTDPTKWDTDGDSLTTLDQNGDMSQPMNDYQEWLLGSRPDLSDTDRDGIYDGWEVWLGRGLIPGMDPIKLDLLNPDTDNDTIPDGVELVVANMSTLLNPYIGFYLIFPFDSSPVLADSDDDTIPDNIELEIGTMLNNNDTDNDTISDAAEYYVWHTDPTLNDTDGDGLTDPEELFGFEYPPTNSSSLGLSALIYTDANNSDSDGDLLPDGAEVYFYKTDPTNPDENHNDILDGMEVDTDGDGLFDGEEWYVYNTAAVGYVDRPGGINNPDSDADGLFDGLEVYDIGTNASLWDTDNDTYSDGLEVYCNTDPLDNSTTEGEINMCFDSLVRLAILSPVHTHTYHTNAVPIIVYDSTGNATSMNFKFRVENGSWSAPVAMHEQNSTSGYWRANYEAFPVANATYELEVTAAVNGETVTRDSSFTVALVAGDLLRIKTPNNGQTYKFNAIEKPKLPIEVETGLEINDVWFRMKTLSGDIITDNTTLQYTPGRHTFYLPDYEFPKKGGDNKYVLEVFGNKTNGVVLVASSVFTISAPSAKDLAVIGVGTIGGLGAIGLGAKTALSGGLKIGGKRIGKKRDSPFKNPFKKGGNSSGLGGSGSSSSSSVRKMKPKRRVPSRIRRNP